MRHAIRAGTRLALALLLAAAPAAAQDLADVTIETIPVAGNVHMLFSGVAGNVAVSAGEDGILVVDDKVGPLADRLRAAIAGVSEGELAFLLNTHWHGDHTGANPAFGEEATIVAHHNVRQRLSTRQEARGNVVEPLPDEGLPVITFGDSLSIWFNGEEIRAIHLPRGHTDGDVAVWFTGSNVVHMGDQYFSNMLPFVDLDSGGDVVAYAANVAAVLELVPDDAKVIPGHGELSTVAELREFHRMLVETIGAVRDGIEAGDDLEALKAAGLPAPWGEWAWGFITEEAWIEIVHASLTASGDGPSSSHGH